MDKEKLIQELQFKASRSSGAGGQHVNKTSSKVTLFWALKDSKVLSEEQRHRIAVKLKNHLTNEGVLIISSQATRSQHKNKERVIKKFFKTLAEALREPKRRKKTRPSLSAKRKRLTAKKQQAQKKANRQKPEY